MVRRAKQLLYFEGEYPASNAIPQYWKTPGKAGVCGRGPRSQLFTSPWGHFNSTRHWSYRVRHRDSLSTRNGNSARPSTPVFKDTHFSIIIMLCGKKHFMSSANLGCCCIPSPDVKLLLQRKKRGKQIHASPLAWGGFQYRYQ